jgi:hypothetical protein
MLDPRIYRTGFIAVAVAAVVLAFSLRDQAGPLTTTLDPGAFNGQNAYSLSNQIASEYPNRRPGSAGDDALAGDVTQRLSSYGFAVSTSTTSARTADGTRTLENVIATRPGFGGGSVVVIAHRDALSSPAPVEASGTAVLLELARALSGETHQRTIVLASISGSAGASGALALARQLGGGIDAVIALGDVGGSALRKPLIVPWSDGQQVAPPALRNTLASALGAQAALDPGGTSLAGQFVHLALPVTLSEQGPFGARGTPAVLLSASGERAPDANDQLSLGRITALGRTVLQTVNALDAGAGIPAAAPYMLYDSKVVPAWAIALLALALILPVGIATVDGLARARRRGYALVRWATWTLLAAVPFVLAALLAVGARLVGWLSAAPPEPVAGALPVGGGGITLLIVLGGLLVGSLAVLRRLAPPPDEGTGLGVLIVLCVISLAIWVRNPFAALLLVPALHLWMWLLDPEVRISRGGAITLFVLGLAPPVLVVLYYAVTLGLGPLGALWSGLLMIAGGSVGLVAAIEWSVALGCVVCAAALAMHRAEPQLDDQPVTIRGPVTYAGPGSLGGTDSALRARR